MHFCLNLISKIKIMQLLTYLNSFWNTLFFGSEDFSFIAEVVIRTVIMFLVIIIGLRFLGKRGVKQLSVFELVVIIGLGSAAGDPMFYKEVGIIFSMVAFAIIILLYAIITYIIAKSKRFEHLLEGKAVCLINNGVFEIENFNKENLGSDEFFAELRSKGVSHLGQIETAIEETSGEISVFFLKDEDVKYGLPIMLHSLENPLVHIETQDYYACTFCGYTEQKAMGKPNACKNCKNTKWVKASKKLRVT